MNAEPLLTFPCDFPLKVMGEMRPGFAEDIVRVVQEHAPEFSATAMEMRSSSSGRYISLTCTLRATSQQQLDALYRALSDHPQVKVVL